MSIFLSSPPIEMKSTHISIYEQTLILASSYIMYYILMSKFISILIYHTKRKLHGITCYLDNII